MRGPCGLGYLLARLSDTVADAADAPVSLRRHWLDALRERFLSPDPGRDADALAVALAADLVPFVSLPAERELLRRADAGLRLLGECPPEPRACLREVLDAITRGQRQDLDHFGDASADRPRRLPDDAALVAYADDVAGSVGRFWTGIGFLADPRFSRLPRDTMGELGTAYGRALQVVNILRDLHEDLPRGRAYLPDDPVRTVPLWLDRAEAGLRDGVRYAESLRGRRVRLATVLPALLGAATVRLLREHHPESLRRRIKVSRPEVASILRGAAWRTLAGTGYASAFRSRIQPKRSNGSGTAASKRSGSPETG
jgi:farnesyl-diphosphate farnesyltransferase